MQSNQTDLKTMFNKVSAHQKADEKHVENKQHIQEPSQQQQTPQVVKLSEVGFTPVNQPSSNLPHSNTEIKAEKQEKKEMKEEKKKMKEEGIEHVKTQFQIVAKRKINHDCYIYDLKWAGQKFNLEIGQHFRIIQNIPTWEHPQGEEVIRKYTPISPCNKNQEIVQLLIKIYRPKVNPNFPQGGKLTPYLQNLEVGGKINVDGPYGKFGYKPGGVVILDGVEHKAKKIFFIAGGSGITPCYQTISEIIAMPDETIELILLFANKTQEDIVLRKELESFQPRLKIMYVIDVSPPLWKYFGGHATKQMLEGICPLNEPQTIYIHCGPPGMNKMIREVFAKYYPDSIIFKY